MTDDFDQKNKPMSFGSLEELYDLMAESLDEVGVDQHSLFLSKLSMVLAHRIGNLEAVVEAVKIAKEDLVRDQSE